MKNFFYIAVLILLIFLAPDKFETFDSGYNFLLSIIYFSVVIFFLFQQSRINKNWLRFDVLFLIGFSIVHIQIPFLESIGIEPERPHFIWINKQVVNFATWMSTVAVILWILGFGLTKKSNNNKLNIADVANPKVNYFKFDSILLLSFITFLLLVGNSFFKGAYDVGNWGTGANYAFLILRILLYLRVVYFFKEFDNHTSIHMIIKRSLSNKIFITILALYVFLFFMTGDRGPVLQVALIVGGSYALYIRPISFKRLMFFIFLGAFVFAILRFGRGRDAGEFNDGNIFQRGYASYSESEQGVNVTDELATSVRIQYRALDVVPHKHPYLYGLTFATVGVGIIPFAGSTVISIFEIPKMYAGSAMFFTIIGQGPNPTYGEGSEILGDIYINFGLYGTFIIMFFFGLFSAKIYQRANRLEFSYVLIFLGLLISAITINRGMLFTPLKDIVYLLFFNFLFTRVVK